LSTSITALGLAQTDNLPVDEIKQCIVEAGKTLATQTEKIVAQFEKEKSAAKKHEVKKSKTIPADWARPTVMVIIPEMHVSRPALIDPAGETEIVKRLLEANFKVVDSEYVQLMKTGQLQSNKSFKNLKTCTEYAKQKDVDILLYGEAVSEQAANLGDFTGCRARIELKAINAETDEILLTDSAEGGATDLSEAVAGKKAIRQAAIRLADTFLYNLAEKWNKQLRAL